MRGWLNAPMHLWSLLADDAVTMAGVLGLVWVVPLIALRIIRLALVRARSPVAAVVVASAASAMFVAAAATSHR
ncbi:MAG: hypothetical protein E6J14_08060 [Chloroflexi bacterium]|nr:MAG: hypothetical protein E6J14_08060 [Chloroflexota bacterium]